MSVVPTLRSNLEGGEEEQKREGGRRRGEGERSKERRRRRREKKGEEEKGIRENINFKIGIIKTSGNFFQQNYTTRFQYLIFVLHHVTMHTSFECLYSMVW